MAKWTKVPDIAKLEDEKLFRVNVDGNELCIGLVNDKPFAVDNVCSHQEYPLHDGRITEDGLLRCRYHGAKFDPFNGAVKTMPATFPLNAHPIEIRPDGVFVFV